MGKKVFKKVIEKPKKKTAFEKKGISTEPKGQVFNRPEPKKENTINRGHPSLKVE